MKRIALLLLLLTLPLLLLAACQGDTPPADTDGGSGTAAPDGGQATDPADPDGVTADQSGGSSEEPTEEATEPDSAPDAPDVMTRNPVYPTPLELTYGATDIPVAAVTPNEAAADYIHLLADCGVTASEGGLPLTVTLRDMDEFSYGAEEAYCLTVSESGITVEAQTDRGVYYAFMTLRQMIAEGKCPAAAVKDAPRNPLRGVIEGFYGAAWTHEYRKELFAFMGDYKMNAYIYAPKDDPKHRAQWRSRYTGAELERMTDLITAAGESRVKFIYAISPGGDINLGSGYEADFKKLMAKCEQIYELGCRDFAIFLDDIPTLDAEGHAKLLNDFQTQFVQTHEGVSDLIAITTEYTDPFLTSYTDKIAPLIHEDVILMWTGPGVVPETITNASLKTIIRKYGRNVLIWWNYPVNDVLVNNLYMGAC